jgi:hypothetical protein
MALITATNRDWADMYDGFDMQKVGIGLSNPNIYATSDYARKKQQYLVLGGLADVVYSGFEHDIEPLILSMHYETQYNTVLALNLHYIPEKYRQAILKYVLAANYSNLKTNRPLIVDYYMLKHQIPAIEGIVRRYKVTGIRVVGNVPIIDWAKAIKGVSRWQDMYRVRS